MVDLWFDAWVASIVSRIPILWPPDDAEFWAVLRKALTISGADQQVADEASHRLAQAPPKFAADVIDPLKKHIRDVFRERDNAGTGDPSRSRESAETASRDCLDCRGNGLTVRYRHVGVGSVPCYCLCPLGRWIEGVHRSKHQDVHTRIVDLARAANFGLRLGSVAWRNLPDNRYRYRPVEWDFAADRPLPDPRGRNVDAAAEPIGIAPVLARVLAEAERKAQPAGVPAGLTPSQEIFVFTLGDHWRNRLFAAPPALRDEILADFASSVDPSRVVPAVRRLATGT